MRQDMQTASTMGLGTKNRLTQTAEACRQHLRDRYRSKLPLVEEFILEIEGVGSSRDPAKWSQYTDTRRSEKETLERVGQEFEKWLNP
jgi:hypothetical protein